MLVEVDQHFEHCFTRNAQTYTTAISDHKITDRPSKTLQTTTKQNKTPRGSR
ncbi:hypothetical protein GMES_0839 [Paraglaciecola mesophila KMM 241]|uniref:Uncharacterized protein n=1 Tax=Paraglaciecola mesophila KMM 241 TaxID=1128912 RepID=K6XR84_9ALTE|nr:hypothetical protein GMES_0839 [Paraglaciecola mesophila KMM 241]